MDFEISSSKVRLEIETALFDPNKIDDSVINYINKNNLYSKKYMSPKKLRDKVIESLEELKAVDQVCLDVSSLTTLTDFMIIVTGTSSRHIQSLADRVVEDLKNLNIRPLSLEERSQEWVLVDYGDVIVHLMSSSLRTFYDLESLWDEDL